MLPDYLRKAVPNPRENRGPWYKNTAPAYAGVFLWIGFYQAIGEGTVTRANLPICLLALLCASIISYAFYYYAPAMLGMKTGLPLYVVGASTFGTKGGYLMPGLLMGVLQIGWFAVSTHLATTFILEGIGSSPLPRTIPFTAIAIVWAYALAWIGIKGIRYVARVATIINILPLLMLLIVFLKTRGGITNYSVQGGNSFAGFCRVIDIVIGYFATAGAAGADFGMNSRNAHDVRAGGVIGIIAASLFAGSLPLLSIVGAHGLHPDLQSFSYDAVVGSVGGILSASMFLLYAVASIPSGCFCAFIAGNSFTTMFPSVPRVTSSLIGVTIALLLAITGLAANLVTFFLIVGASFGPICGAMLADYLLSGRTWAGPREGVNWAGYVAWASGFLLGVLPFLPVPATWIARMQPTTLYSFGAGFIIYALLKKLGLESKPAAGLENPELLTADGPSIR